MANEECNYIKKGLQLRVGANAMLGGSAAELFIGDHCRISTGVQIYTHDTVLNYVSGGKDPKVVGTVHIGKNCYIAHCSGGIYSVGENKSLKLKYEVVA